MRTNTELKEQISFLMEQYDLYGILDLIQKREVEATNLLKTCLKLDVFDLACSQHVYWNEPFLEAETELLGRKVTEYLEDLANPTGKEK